MGWIGTPQGMLWLRNTDLLSTAAILFVAHTKYTWPNRGLKGNSLAPFYVLIISAMIILTSAGNLTKIAVHSMMLAYWVSLEGARSDYMYFTNESVDLLHIQSSFSISRRNQISQISIALKKIKIGLT